MNMAELNIIKVDGNIDISNSKLNPFNWFRKKYTKETVNILFVDDCDMPVVQNLEKAGYRVRKVNDIKDPEDPEVKHAQVIFIDFDGVGRSISAHQGAGLVKEIKSIFDAKKYVVLYTAQPTLPADTVMRDLFNRADARLRKDADITDFTEQIRAAIATKKLG